MTTQALDSQDLSTLYASKKVEIKCLKYTVQSLHDEVDELIQVVDYWFNNDAKLTRKIKKLEAELDQARETIALNVTVEDLLQARS